MSSSSETNHSFPNSQDVIPQPETSIQQESSSSSFYKSADDMSPSFVKPTHRRFPKRKASTANITENPQSQRRTRRRYKLTEDIPPEKVKEKGESFLEITGYNIRDPQSIIGQALLRLEKEQELELLKEKETQLSDEDVTEVQPSSNDTTTDDDTDSSIDCEFSYAIIQEVETYFSKDCLDKHGIKRHTKINLVS